MIDTGKYEGHTRGPWFYYDDGGISSSIRLYHQPYMDSDGDDIEENLAEIHYDENCIADARLMTDAPLILQALIDERAEVKRLREQLDRVTKQCGALWSITDMWTMCEDDYTMHDQYENLDERYAYHDDGYIILKEMWTLTEEDGWQPKEMIE